MHSPEVEGSGGKAVSEVECLIQRYSAHLESLQKSPRTVKEYVKDVRAWLRWWDQPPERFDEAGWDMWMEYETERGVKGSSIVRHRVSVRRFFKFLRRKHIIANDHDPSRDCETISIRERLPVYCTEAEVQLILSRVRGARGRAVLTLLYECGLRNAEVRALNLEDVGTEFIHVINSKRGKERYVPVSDEALATIHAWIRERDCVAPYLFHTAAGNRLDEIQIQKLVRRLSKGIPKRVTPHVLRHSIATHLHNRGVDIRDIQIFLGHGSIQVTMKYVHVANERLRQVVLNAHPMA